MDAIRQIAAWEAGAERRLFSSGSVLPTSSRDGSQSRKREQRHPSKKTMQAWILPEHLDSNETDLSPEKTAAGRVGGKDRPTLNLLA